MDSQYLLGSVTIPTAYQCRNCGSNDLRELGFIGILAGFFLKRIFHAEITTRISTSPKKRKLQTLSAPLQRLLGRLHPPGVAVEVQSCQNCSFIQTKFPFADDAISRLYVDYRYYGTGDIGGAPRENSIKLMEAIVTQGTTTLPSERNATAKTEPVKVGDGPLHVVQTNSEQMFLDIKPEDVVHMPHYTGDLELTEHSAGSLTSEAYMKRWNRENETLADAAERASVAAAWLGGRPYPKDRLTNAWTLVMGGQFHDLIPGTATPKAYEYAWNDQSVAMNQFGGVLQSAADDDDRRGRSHQ